MILGKGKIKTIELQNNEKAFLIEVYINVVFYKELTTVERTLIPFFSENYLYFYEKFMLFLCFYKVFFENNSLLNALLNLQIMMIKILLNFLYIL